MESTMRSAKTGPVDHGLIEGIETELALALARATKLDADAEDLANSALGGADALQPISANLEKWQIQLADLARTAAVAEIELDEQEAALRGWFDSLLATKGRLESAVISAH
jgi:hypothetical protein